MKILLVDDGVDTLELLDSFLTTQGHTVVTATNGEEALKKAMREMPDLMLLDVCLPDIDGLAVLKKIKEVDPDLPVVMITAYRDAEKVVESFRLGAVDCLLKPFNFDYVTSHILSWKRGANSSNKKLEKE
ncbi:MAG: response regulator [Elusimicrobiota bacterium]